MTKFIQILLISLLISCSSTKSGIKGNTNETIIGTWIIEQSTFNEIGSPVPENTSLKFTDDNRIKITLPKFGENYEDVSGTGNWKRNDGIITIEYDNVELWGGKQSWRILKLTKDKLEWEMKMNDGIQKEKYSRKQ